MDKFLALGLAVFTLLFFGLVGYWTAGVWNECRLDHSWFYCLRLISK